MLAVAVCTNRDAPAVADSLAALVAQVPAGRLALVTSGLASAAVARHAAAAPSAALLSEPSTGLSHARNRALAWAAERRARAIAFVDDDAIAEPDWYRNLERHWGEAPVDVACIGGPIRPRYAVPPPAWVSPRITHVLTLLDRGSETRDLDPHVEAVYGANISFGVGPLQRIGGFDPSLGHAGTRVFFGEEDDAQRRLVAAGYRVRYVPDAAVWHVIPQDRLTRRSFLRRRYAFGVALGMRGGRPLRVAVRQAASSAAGAIAAAGRRDQALAIERAVRAAENVGALRGALARRSAPRAPGT